MIILFQNRDGPSLFLVARRKAQTRVNIFMTDGSFKKRQISNKINTPPNRQSSRDNESNVPFPFVFHLYSIMPVPHFYRLKSCWFLILLLRHRRTINVCPKIRVPFFCNVYSFWSVKNFFAPSLHSSVPPKHILTENCMFKNKICAVLILGRKNKDSFRVSEWKTKKIY